MKVARLRLILAAVLFLAWLGWLAAAVLQKDAVDVLSRAQLTEATVLVVAEVAADGEGLPDPKVTVVKTLKGTLEGDGKSIEVLNLRKAALPGKGFPAASTYLIPLTFDKVMGYSVAGLPRSPGYEAANPERPPIYPWNDNTRKQLAKLGIASE